VRATETRIEACSAYRHDRGPGDGGRANRTEDASTASHQRHQQQRRPRQRDRNMVTPPAGPVTAAQAYDVRQERYEEMGEA
jgi:hypothetical protein